MKLALAAANASFMAGEGRRLHQPPTLAVWLPGATLLRLVWFAAPTQTVTVWIDKQMDLRM